MTDADALIARLNLSRHPEGGWYRQTWAAEAAPGQRPAGTAILFLLKAGERSHWHRVDADEIWLWHAGAPLELAISAQDQGPAQRHVLGGDVLVGQAPQVICPPVTGRARAALASIRWSVAPSRPGFDSTDSSLRRPTSTSREAQGARLFIPAALH